MCNCRRACTQGGPTLIEGGREEMSGMEGVDLPDELEDGVRRRVADEKAAQFYFGGREGGRAAACA